MRTQKSMGFTGPGLLGLAMAAWLMASGSAQAVLPPPAVAAGASHSCAVVSGGVRCWGSNDYGELGAPSFGDVDLATNVSTLEPGTNAGVTAVATGEHHSCAIVNGAVACWGRNAEGQLGLGDTMERRSPALVPNLTGVIALAAGRHHTCAVYSDADVNKGVKCWGENTSGQLGLGDISGGHTSPPATALLNGVLSIAAGDTHTCVSIENGGAMWCWGSNDHGQLGIGEVGCDDADCASPNLVPNLSAIVVAVGAGNAHTCAVTQVGSMLCWGANDKGQLGLGPDAMCDVPTPTVLPNLQFGAIAVSGGNGFTCGVVDSGVRCWGDGARGQQGDGSTTQAPLPHNVLNLSLPGNTPTQVSAGTDHACALYNNELYCWGDTAHGMIGSDKDGRALVPQTVSLASVQAIAPGREHGCALAAGGAVSCWGRNDFGQVGDGTKKDVAGPKVVIASGALAVATGDQHSCALMTGGTVRCWGRNQWGQLGLNDNNDRTLPAVVGNLGGVTSISLGSLHTCALYSSGNVTGGVKCWGRNTDGELGFSSNAACIQPIACLIPAAIPGLAGMKAVSASTFYTCAIDANNEVQCWGKNNYGQLGQGDQITRKTPTKLPGLSGVTALSAGDGHACAIYTSGAVNAGLKCWGRNYYGELGLGDNPSCGGAFPYLCTSATAVPNWSDATAVAAGSYHTCAIGTFGAVGCWGWGEEGQLGSGWLDDWAVPHAIPGLIGANSIGANWEHTCAALADGSARCWGRKLFGRLGNFVSGLVTSPDKVLTNDVIFANRFEKKL